MNISGNTFSSSINAGKSEIPKMEKDGIKAGKLENIVDQSKPQGSGEGTINIKDESKVKEAFMGKEAINRMDKFSDNMLRFPEKVKNNNVVDKTLEKDFVKENDFIPKTETGMSSEDVDLAVKSFEHLASSDPETRKLGWKEVSELRTKYPELNDFHLNKDNSLDVVTTNGERFTGVTKQNPQGIKDNEYQQQGLTFAQQEAKIKRQKAKVESEEK